MQIDDPRAPQRAAADPSASVWVGASAGTGKTKILTDRVLNLMLAGTPPEHILCLTFTKAAAAEMRTRIAEQLAQWAAMAEAELARRELPELLGREPTGEQVALARRLFARVLDTPGGLNIRTIHAFCQSVLGRFPLEAGIAPHFAVVDERDAGELLRAARDALLQAIPAHGGELAAALAALIPHVHETRFSDLIGLLASERRRIEALFARCGGIEAAVDAIRDRLGLAPGDDAGALLARACADDAFDGQALRAAAAALRQGGKNDGKLAAALERWLSATPGARPALFDDYARAFLYANREPPAIKERLVSKGALAMAGLEAALRREAERVHAVVLALRAAHTAAATAALLRLGGVLLAEYRRQKARRSLLDYDDLIHDAAQLLTDSGAAWVLYKLDGGIDHVLIDEAQDTSPEQWRVIRELTAEFFAGRGARDVARTVFAVGDVKQSIFSFQGADPEAFLANRDWYGARATAAGAIWRPVDLSVSFRSTRAVLAAVDAVFRRDEARDGVALDRHPIVHQAYRQRDGGAVELWPLIAPRMAEELAPWTPPVRRIAADAPPLRLARIVARRIARMVTDEEPLPSQGRPIRAGDVLVLVRRRSGFVEELVRTLKAHSVAVAGVDRMVLAEQMAVMDLIALGHFALLPTDDLTLATVLKGPLIGLDEDRLLALAAGRGGASLWRTLSARAADDGAFAGAREVLSSILALADAVPPFEFYAEILGPFGGRRRLLGRLGRDAEDAIGEFMECALGYERTHLPTLQGFLQWFETGRVEVKRDLEQGAAADAVRVMTVHGAKGLQAPVVFLPDTTQLPQDRGPALLWTDDGAGDEIVLWPPRRAFDDAVAEAARARRRARERAEYRRLLYVAMTRAKDRLIVCGWRTAREAPDGCWYRLVRDGLDAARRDLGLVDVEDPFLAGDPEFEGPPIVGYLTCPQEVPVAVGPPPLAPPPPPLPDWARREPPAEPAPPRPLVPSPPAPGVSGGLLAADATGLDRGRLIHRLLETLPALAPAGRRAAGRAWLDRHATALPDHARAEILDRVLALLDDPALAALFAADGLAEVPFCATLGGRPVTGRLDRLLVTADAVIALDYKTDRAPPATPDRVPAAYLRQMAAYRAALAAIYPGRPVRCLLLWTETPALMPLDDALLAAALPETG